MEKFLIIRMKRKVNINHQLLTHRLLVTIYKEATGMAVSWCQHVGELLLWPGDAVDLDTRGRPLASRHHNCVLELDCAGVT